MQHQLSLLLLLISFTSRNLHDCLFFSCKTYVGGVMILGESRLRTSLF